MVIEFKDVAVKHIVGSTLVSKNRIFVRFLSGVCFILLLFLLLFLLCFLLLSLLMKCGTLSSANETVVKDGMIYTSKWN